MLIRNPIVWLRRFLHRRGYGIHSPYAFGLVTQVVYNPGEYYADRWLARLHPWYVRLFHLRPLACHRLLFRLANHFQPHLIAAPDGVSTVEWNYLHEGCRQAIIDPGMPRGEADMFILKDNHPEALQHITEHSLLVVSDLRHNQPLWQTVKSDPRTRVTFDLYDLGLVLFNPKLNKQNYIVNW